MNTHFATGQHVSVEVFGGKTLTKVVVEDLGETVLICRPEEFEAAKIQHRAPVSVGFQKKYIHKEVPQEGMD